MYFYNITSERCEEMVWTRCGGNANRLWFRSACIRKCAPDCYEGVDPGLCEQYVPRYYYNSLTDDCDKFTYGGCWGNKNNFVKRNDCLETCGDICKLDSRTGDCDVTTHRYFYDRTSSTCQTFIYGGCGGNSNNFETKEQCMATCPPR